MQLNRSQVEIEFDKVFGYLKSSKLEDKDFYLISPQIYVFDVQTNSGTMKDLCVFPSSIENQQFRGLENLEGNGLVGNISWNETQPSGQWRDFYIDIDQKDGGHMGEVNAVDSLFLPSSVVRLIHSSSREGLGIFYGRSAHRYFNNS